MTPDTFAKMGSIRVTFYRANQVQNNDKEFYIPDGKLLDVVDAVPEVVAKGSDVKANTKSVMPCGCPSPTDHLELYLVCLLRHLSPETLNTIQLTASMARYTNSSSSTDLEVSYHRCTRLPD